MKNKDIEKLLEEKGKLLIPDISLKQKILDEAEKIPIPTRRKTSFKFKLILAFSLIAFIFVSLFGGLNFYNEEYEKVYIDVNPSIELSLNRFDVVNKVEYLNSDAENLSDEINVKGKNSGDALELILDILNKKGYLNENAELYISVYGKNNEKVEKLLQKLQNKAEDVKEKKAYKYNVNTKKVTKEETESAKEAGLSPEKYKIICDIIEADKSYTIGDLQDKSMKELKNLLKELTDGKSADSESSHKKTQN